MTDTLNTLLREPKSVTVAGRAYPLKPFGVRAVPVMSRLVADIWGELVQRPDLLANRDALIGWLLLRLPNMIETKIDDLLALLAMQTGEPVKALEAMPLDDFIELGRAALEDGLDFFTRRVMPQMKAAMAGYGIGPTPSTPSSPPGTADPT